MNKLTKEQADMLIAEIENHASKNIHLERFSHFQLDVLLRLINQCTEKDEDENKDEDPPLLKDLKLMAKDLQKTRDSLQKLWGYFHDFTNGVYR